MPLPPQQTGSYQYVSSTSLGSSRTETVRPLLVEYFVDYTCPFSRKIFNTLLEVYEALDRAGSATPSTPTVWFQMHQVPQPWHPQSTMTHEAALAVRKLSGEEKYFEFSGRLFNDQVEFFDDNVWTKP